MDTNQHRYKKAQAKRRKTLFPLSHKQVHEQRIVIAAWLFNKGLNYYAIRQVLTVSPDMARTLVAKCRNRGLVN